MNWWDAPEYDRNPMFFPKLRADAPRQRVALTTDPEMVRTKQGALRLRLVNRHPHERLRLYVGPRQACRT